MSSIPVIKSKDFYKLLLKFGCVAVSVRGSHHKIRNPGTGKTSTIAVHTNKDAGVGTFSVTLSQLGIDTNEFLEFMQNQ